MGLLHGKNKVIAGDYIDGKIMLAGEKVVLSIRLGAMIVLNQKMVTAYEIVSETKGSHTISLSFSDGKKSLLDLDDAMTKALLAQLF